MRKLLVAAAAMALSLVAGCAPVAGPAHPREDSGAKAPNGILSSPDRPAGIPTDAHQLNIHVDIVDVDRHERGPGRAHVNIDAQSSVPGANVHGAYPFDIYTFTPYTHTIWYPPGLVIHVSVTATADPLLADGLLLSCEMSQFGAYVTTFDASNDPSICVIVATVN